MHGGYGHVKGIILGLGRQGSISEKRFGERDDRLRDRQ